MSVLDPNVTKIRGANVAGGSDLNASFEDDGSGFGTLRIVDAAPFAYNSTEDALQAAITRTTSLYNTPQTGSVGAGGAMDTTISPPAGKMWILKQIRLNIAGPSGATTGNHRMVGYIGASKEMQVFSYIASYNESITVRQGLVVSPSSNAEPPTAQLANVMTNLMWTPSIPLVIRYQNDTDASQGTQRDIKMLLEEVPLV